MAEIHRTVKFTPQKERQWRRHAVDQYEKDFTIRWLRDPSAKATRNRYRQVLDPATEAPYIQTLLRGSYAGIDEEVPDYIDKKISPQVDFVGMNKTLQMKPRMTLHEKRQFAVDKIREHRDRFTTERDRRCQSAMGIRTTSVSKINEESVPLAVADTPGTAVVYQEMLDILNRRRKQRGTSNDKLIHTLMAQTQQISDHVLPSQQHHNHHASSPTMSGAAGNTGLRAQSVPPTTTYLSDNSAEKRIATRQKIEEIVRLRREEAALGSSQPRAHQVTASQDKIVRSAAMTEKKLQDTLHDLHMDDDEEGQPSRPMSAGAVSSKFNRSSAANNNNNINRFNVHYASPAAIRVNVADHTTKSFAVKVAGMPERRSPNFVMPKK